MFSAFPFSDAVSQEDLAIIDEALKPENYAETRKISPTAQEQYCENTVVEQSLLMESSDKTRRAMIGCQKTHDPKPVIDITDDVTIFNLDVRNVHLNITKDDVTLTIVRSSITNTTIEQITGGKVTLQIMNTTFTGQMNLSCIEEIKCESLSHIKLQPTSLSLWYFNSKFLHTRLTITAASAEKVIAGYTMIHF